MTNLLSDIGSLGGNFEDLMEKLNNLRDNVTEFKGEFGDEKDHTVKRFEEFRDKNHELQDKLAKFYKNANENFTIAEEGLIKLGNFINEIDSRITTEELINRCCLDDIEQRTAAEMQVLNQHSDLQD